MQNVKSPDLEPRRQLKHDWSANIFTLQNLSLGEKTQIFRLHSMITRLKSYAENSCKILVIPCHPELPEAEAPCVQYEPRATD